MTSRLYRTTRPLATQVALMLDRLGISGVGSPTTAALNALYVSGLTLLDGRQTQTRVALFLPGRAHDALNRLLRVVPLSTRALMGALVAWLKRYGEDGYLCLDDCVVEKAFAKKLSCLGGVDLLLCQEAQGLRAARGGHLVVQLRWRVAHPRGLPLVATQALVRATRLPNQAQAGRGDAQGGRRFWAASRIYRPRHPLHGRVVHQDGRTSGAGVGRGTLHPRTIVFWGARRRSVGELARVVPLKWRK
jgi:hypothetical protein